MTTPAADQHTLSAHPSLAARALTALIGLYRLVISPAQLILFGAGAGCRFTPTCSVYAQEALRTHGALGGTILAARRVCRCHPWGGCGPDPVPGQRMERKRLC